MRGASSLLFIFIYVIYNVTGKPLPVALIHGIGDACNFPQLIELVNFLKVKLKTEVECIEIGNGFVSSWFMQFSKQAEQVCDKIKNNELFKNNFSIFGISQGSLLSRYIIQKCEMPGKVVNFISFDGPQMGIGSLPKITCPIICPVINSVVGKIIYNDFLQRNLGPAGYYKNKNNYEDFLKYSTFLADLNNEREVKNINYKLRFSSLDKILLIKNNQDSVITPRESSWFQFYDKEGKEIVPLKDSNFYKEDYIGLRILDEQGKITFVELEGDHVIISYEDIEKYIIPFLQ